MKVQKLMTEQELQYCSPQTSIKEASKLMKTANCGVLPVVDKEKHVIGILTDRDIALSISEQKSENISDIQVDKVMTRNVQTVKETDDIKDALKTMRINKVGRLPVVNEKGTLSGILTIHRLLEDSFAVGKSAIGDHRSSDENLAKTIHSLNERYGKTAKVGTK